MASVDSASPASAPVGANPVKSAAGPEAPAGQMNGKEELQSAFAAVTAPLEEQQDATAVNTGNQAAGVIKKQSDGEDILVIPDDFKPTQGAKLTEGLFVGKTLGSGMQGGVYELLDENGKDTQQVLKIAHAAGIGTVMVDLEREWRVGLALNNLSDPSIAIKGFMGVGLGLRNQNGKFRGVIFERLHGRNLDKVLENRDFHDVKYIRQMLFEILSALDEAQSRYGFAHHDFRAANLMEHRPEPKRPPVKAQLKRTKTGLEYDTEDASVTSTPSEDLSKITFKIIDYGLANFDQLYAADVSFKDRRRASSVNENIPEPAGKKGCNMVECMYHSFWGTKGDVHHLLWSMIPYLDGRVWPEGDRREVLQLLNLVHHCTGVKLNAWFAPIATNEKAEKPTAVCGIFESREGKLWLVRRARLRILGLRCPVNPGLTAAEALTAPLFAVYSQRRGGGAKQVAASQNPSALEGEGHL